MTEYNNRVRKQILSKILILTETEHQEIFKILRNVNIPFTQNCNGVFFNFSLVPNNIVQSIDEFVNFCLENKKDLCSLNWGSLHIQCLNKSPFQFS